MAMIFLNIYSDKAIKKNSTRFVPNLN